MTLSVIVPTRNRADLWRSGWILDALESQTEPPDELVVALDHTDDDTADVIRAAAPPFPTRILEVLSPRPGPDPASAVPDNCLFAAATGDVLVHLDDDITIPPDFCRRMRGLMDAHPRAIIWAYLLFVNADLSLLIDDPPVDYRPALAAKRRWPFSPDGIFQLPANRTLHWGAAWAAPRAEILAIGGHDLTLAKYRNADTRLGNRLVRAGLTSYVTSTADLTAYHLGTTWKASRRHADRRRARTRGPTGGPKVTNGGPAYWTSDACRLSFRTITELDSPPRQATI